MRHQPSRAWLSTFLVVLALGAVAGCGDDSDGDSDVPPDAVARVGDTVITKQHARDFLPGQAKDAQARKRLAQYLVVAEWVRREAEREDVSVPTSAIERSLDKRKADTPRAVAQLEGILLIGALTEKAAGGPVPEADIARYYREHPREYAFPEVRYMRLVATDSRAQAVAAKRALEQGRGWKGVIDRYGTSRTVTPPSGDMGAQPGEMPDALGDALYAASRGTFNGPVKTEDAWYVFELVVIDRLPRQSLAQVRQPLRIRLEGRQMKGAVKLVHRRLRDRYRPITVCNQRLLLAVCHNGPPLEFDSNGALAL